MRTLPATLLGVLAVVLAGATAITRQASFQHHEQTQHYSDRYYLPPPDYLLIGSLGYREAMADLVWVAALNNFGQELLHRGAAKYVFHYADAAITLDPDFRRVYTWIGTTAMYRAVAPTLAAAKQAAPYLEAAAKRFPDDGELMWQAGAHFAYEMPPLTDDREEAERYRQRGMPYLEAAALMGGGPPWLGLIAATNMTKLGQQERAIHHLTQLYMSTSDPNTKDEIRVRLARLKSASFSEALAQSERQFRERKLADFPYLDDTLYLLVGPRPPFDGVTQLKRYFDPAPDPLTSASSASAPTSSQPR